ncbi:TolC family protein [Vibrio parahaemolyticus]
MKLKLPFICIGLLLSGCSNHLEPVQEEIQKNRDFNHDWVTSFQAPYLNLLIIELLHSNQRIDIAYNELIKGKLTTKLKEYEHSIGMSAGISSSHSRKLDSSQNTANTYSSNFGLTYTLDVFGKKNKEEQSYQLDNVQLIHNYFDIADSAVTELVEEYVNLATANQKIILLGQLANAHKKLVSIEKERYKQGVSLNELIRQEEVNLEATLVELKRLKESRISSLNEVQSLIGKHINTSPDNFGTLDDLQMPEMNLSALDTLAYYRNDVITSEINMRKSAIELDISKLNLYPEISFSAVVSGGSDKVKELLENPFGTISSSIIFPFIELHKINVDIEIASITVKQTQSKYESTLLDAVHDINKTLMSVYTNRKQHLLAEARLELARESLTNSEQKMQYGTASNKEVLNSQINMLQSKVSLLDARSDSLLALIRFCNATAFRGCR